MSKIIVLIAGLLLLTCCQPIANVPVTSPTAEATPTAEKVIENTLPTSIPAAGVDVSAMSFDAFETNIKMGRGVNLGNALEAPNEGDWGVTLQEEYFQLIKDKGFNSVRIPIRWSAHAANEAPYTIDPAFLKRVDWAVAQSLSRNLIVVINMHHYLEIFQDPDGNKERFVAIWKQIAEHYKDYPAGLLFEPLNEPNGNLDAAKWNLLLEATLPVIRASNPNRNLVIGPVDWNSFSRLPDLKLPKDDQHILVTFHYYTPFQFTHQGAEWVDGSQAWMGTLWKGDSTSQMLINLDFNAVQRWAKAENRPVYLGEFGAYSKADMDSRALWTTFVARSSESHGFSWAYWEFCSGFGFYDPQLKTWNDRLVTALAPGQ